MWKNEYWFKSDFQWLKGEKEMILTCTHTQFIHFDRYYNACMERNTAEWNDINSDFYRNDYGCVFILAPRHTSNTHTHTCTSIIMKQQADRKDTERIMRWDILFGCFSASISHVGALLLLRFGAPSVDPLNRPLILDFVNTHWVCVHAFVWVCMVSVS